MSPKIKKNILNEGPNQLQFTGFLSQQSKNREEKHSKEKWRTETLNTKFLDTTEQKESNPSQNGSKQERRTNRTEGELREAD